MNFHLLPSPILFQDQPPPPPPRSSRFIPHTIIPPMENRRSRSPSYRSPKGMRNATNQGGTRGRFDDRLLASRFRWVATHRRKKVFHCSRDVRRSTRNTAEITCLLSSAYCYFAAFLISRYDQILRGTRPFETTTKAADSGERSIRTCDPRTRFADSSRETSHHPCLINPLARCCSLAAVNTRGAITTRKATFHREANVTFDALLRNASCSSCVKRGERSYRLIEFSSKRGSTKIHFVRFTE